MIHARTMIITATAISQEVPRWPEEGPPGFEVGVVAADVEMAVVDMGDEDGEADLRLDREREII